MTTKKIGAVRQLGALEHLFWYHDQGTPFHFLMVAEIRGATHAEDWRHALDKLQLRHPMFAMAIRRDEKHALHFVRASGTRIPLAVISGMDAPGWQAIAAKEMATRLEANDAPLVRATVLLQANSAVIMLAAHHAIADGISMSHALWDLVRIVSGDDLPVLPLLPSLEALMAGGAMPGESAATTVSENMAPEWSAAGEAHRPAPSIASLKLDKDQSRRIIDAARQNETTIQAALSAAIVLLRSRYKGLRQDQAIRILTPINLRHAVGLDERPLLAISIGILSASYAAGSVFWDVARKMKSELDRMRAPESLMQSGAAVVKLAEQGMDVAKVGHFMFDRFVSDATISNLGVLPFEEAYGDIVLAAVWGPSVLTGSPGEQVIGVNTFDGNLHLLHTSLDPQPHLLQDVADLLLHEAGGPA